MLAGTVPTGSTPSRLRLYLCVPAFCGADHRLAGHPVELRITCGCGARLLRHADVRLWHRGDLVGCDVAAATELGPSLSRVVSGSARTGL